MVQPHGLCPSRVESPPRPLLEIADIFREHGPRFRQTHALTAEQRKVMWAIENCRTAVLGGHLDVCNACGFAAPSFNSCRNRHCPKCQSLAQAKWMEQRAQRILPTHYFHVVFTLPQQLKPLARDNPKLMFNLLFRAASRTLLEFGQSRLEAQLGFTAVLHTWTRMLLFHPHLHCIVTGGGLNHLQQQWNAANPRFLFPVKAMSRLFRGKFLDALSLAYDQDELELSANASHLRNSPRFRELKDKLYSIDWVVYSKRPFGGPEQVFNYLGRYTHRVGISNRRLIRIDDHGVCFKTKNGNTVTVAPEEFIRRFLLHVLPKGFVKIRHFGLMASSNATSKLVVARQLLEEKTKPTTDTDDPQACSPATQDKDWRERLKELTGIDLTICPRCKKGRMVPYPLPSKFRRINLQTRSPPDQS